MYTFFIYDNFCQHDFNYTYIKLVNQAVIIVIICYIITDIDSIIICASQNQLNINTIMDYTGQPKLNRNQKQFLLAVERGDFATVRSLLKLPRSDMAIDCMDSLGRTALLIAIDNENIHMVRLLTLSGIKIGDALLHAINENFVEAVELLLDLEQSSHKQGQLYSWQRDREHSIFSSDITPLILAAHKNNFEIIKILLDRKVSPIPAPHDPRCDCNKCRMARAEDCLNHSRSRINAFRALASPSLIALSSIDPLLTAFKLSLKLENLSILEPEYVGDYLELRRQCQSFATALLDHTRTSRELQTLLNYSDHNDYHSTLDTTNYTDTHPDIHNYSCNAALQKNINDPNKLNDDGLVTAASLPSIDSVTGRVESYHSHMRLARLMLAIKCKQKAFCAHPNVQQLLASMWYENLPGFRSKNCLSQAIQIVFIGAMFPIYSLAYLIAPKSQMGRYIKKPFIKFICHSASYITFLITLTALGAAPTINTYIYIEVVIYFWVLGLVWAEWKQIRAQRLDYYKANMWNTLDSVANSFYLAAISLRLIAHLQQDENSTKLAREHWPPYDPKLLSEGLFAAASIFSALKLVYIFQVNPYLGPLQISLGRMIIDILKFAWIYVLVLFAFACGMNQLLWYYADLEHHQCLSSITTQLDYVTSTTQMSTETAAVNLTRKATTDDPMPIIDPMSDQSCKVWRKFSNVFESSQTLFWATFGLVDLENFDLIGIKQYTRFWALLMFGIYCFINVIVVLNLLIAMMNHSYEKISGKSDVEWKFARTSLWMSYFDTGSTVPPPFNIVPSIKSFQTGFKFAGRLVLALFKSYQSKTASSPPEFDKINHCRLELKTSANNYADNDKSTGATSYSGLKSSAPEEPTTGPSSVYGCGHWWGHREFDCVDEETTIGGTTTKVHYCDRKRCRKGLCQMEHSRRYQHVIKTLISRYIIKEQRSLLKNRELTEDDCHEIKQEVSALRYEIKKL